MAHVDISAPDSLTPDQAEEVLALHRAAAAADGVAPLSEDSRLAIAGKGSRRRHLLAYAGDDLLGYLGAEVGSDTPAAELVVHPARRREGVGRALVDRLGEPGARIWGHGRLAAAEGFAAALGLEPVRELLKMARPLGPDDAEGSAATLPEGFTARAFVPGADDVAVEAVNAAAFAHHPEQGQMGLEGLRARMAEPWFDPQGLIVVEDASGGIAAGEVAAFHWTKVDPPAAEGGRSGRAHGHGGREASPMDVAGRAHGHGGREASPVAGEVYVVGVAPAYQGRGLARPLTALGLAHLARQGLTTVELYVDGDNAPARATYARLGFETIMVDVMYSHVVHPPVKA